jgi:hypothetical protein
MIFWSSEDALRLPYERCAQLENVIETVFSVS